MKLAMDTGANFEMRKEFWLPDSAVTLLVGKCCPVPGVSQMLEVCRYSCSNSVLAEMERAVLLQLFAWLLGLAF